MKAYAEVIAHNLKTLYSEPAPGFSEFGKIPKIAMRVSAVHFL